MRILMVGSEAVPYAQTGGLADVLGALPRALGRLGHEIDVVIPRYRGITAGAVVAHPSLSGTAAGDRSAVFATERDQGVRMAFVDQSDFFDREFLYGSGSADYPDNAERFAWLSRVALEFASSEPPYDVVHAHDWQAGLVPVLLRREFSSRQTFDRVGSVFTIHNLAYQGLFDISWLPRLGLRPDLLSVDALEYWGRISYLKGGIVFSDTITTVSHRYAQEIQTPEFGFGFDGILRSRSADLVGIVNGIDYDRWDPERDPHLPAPFSAADLKGKASAKRSVLDELGLPADSGSLERPLVGMISRLVDQKGFDLVAALANRLPGLDATFVVLGSGERRYERLFEELAAKHPDRFGVRIGFDESLAHRIEGGADLFLMPSRFEPCGLNQLYSLRYGTVPVVRATGGLADTVQNYDPRRGEGTGFCFDDYTPEALLGTLQTALIVFRDKETWRRIQEAGMREDHSWDTSAREYEAVYERAGAANR